MHNNSAALPAAGRGRELWLLRTLTYVGNLLLLALVFSAFFGTRLALSPAKAQLAADAYTAVQQATIRTYSSQMPIIMALTLLSGVVVLVVLRDHRSPAFWLSLTSLLCVAAILVLTVVGELPLNREMLRWSSTAPPANWEALRDRWELYHSVRAGLSIGALTAQLLAVLIAAARGADACPVSSRHRYGTRWSGAAGRGDR